VGFELEGAKAGTPANFFINSLLFSDFTNNDNVDENTELLDDRFRNNRMEDVSV
jgi:hypothetical protein